MGFNVSFDTSTPYEKLILVIRYICCCCYWLLFNRPVFQKLLEVMSGLPKILWTLHWHRDYRVVWSCFESEIYTHYACFVSEWCRCAAAVTAASEVAWEWRVWEVLKSFLLESQADVGGKDHRWQTGEQ